MIQTSRFQKFIIHLLILQIGLGTSAPVWASSWRSFVPFGTGPGQGQAQPSDDDQKQRALDLAAQIEAAEEGTIAPKSPEDVFGLTGQTLEVFEGDQVRIYDLSDPNVDVPTSAVTDFERDVKVAIDPQTGELLLEFWHHKTNELQARHRFSKIRGVVAFARDKELIIVTTSSGEIYALDAAYGRTAAFKGPIPRTQIAHIDPQLLETGGVEASFLSRNLDPQEFEALREGVDLAPKDQPRFTAGDMVLASGNQKLAILDRTVVLQEVYKAEAVISALAFGVSPGVTPEKTIPLVAIHQQNEAVRQATDENAGLMTDPVIAQALRAITPEQIAALSARAARNTIGLNENRDRYNFKDWAQTFAQAQKKAELEAERKARPALVKARDGLASSFYKLMTPKALKFIAVFTAMGGAAVEVYHLHNGQGPAWAVLMVNSLYAKYWPAVLKDHVYRWTLLKSSLALGSFVPILGAIGILTAKVKGPGWGTIRALASIGPRVYAVIAYPVFHTIVDWANQRNFREAMKRGINPFEQVKANSEIGRQLGLTENVRVGVNPVPNNYTQLNATINQRSKALDAVHAQNTRVRETAWAMAAVAVAEKSGIDVATLSTVALHEKLFKSELNALIQDAEFRKAWIRTAQELEQSLRFMHEKGMKVDLSQVTPELLAEYYGMASKAADEIKSRGKFETAVADLKMRWLNLPQRALAWFATWGVEEHNFLKDADPSDFVADQFWRQFVTDYILAVAQMGLVGDRARFDKPEALAGNEHSFMWTTPGHRSDMIDQVRIYGIDVPSRYMLVYQARAEVAENAYQPLEGKLMEGKVDIEGYVRGMRTMVSGAANLDAAKYGFLFKRDLIRRINTFQASLLMTVVGRVMFGGQHLGDALPAWLWVTIWGTWQYSWLWQPVNRGIQMYGETMEGRANALKLAKTNLGQSLRDDDVANTLASTKELFKLYENSKQELPPALVKQLLEAEELMKRSPDEIAELQRNASGDFYAVEGLRLALNDGDAEAIARASEVLRDRYRLMNREMDPALLAKLNGASLLAFSMQKPPFATKPNAYAEWTATIFGAVMTTLWATTLSVQSFEKNVSWGTRIWESGLKSAGLYMGLYYMDKWQLPKKVADGAKALKNDPGLLSREFWRTCEFYLGGPKAGL